VPLPPEQRALLGRREQPAGGGRADHALDALEAIVERREVPAPAFGTDDPQTPFPFVDRQAPPDAESRGPAVAVEAAVAERAGLVHQSRRRRAGEKAEMSTSVSPLVTKSPTASPVRAAKRIPLRPWPVA